MLFQSLLYGDFGPPRFANTQAADEDQRLTGRRVDRRGALRQLRLQRIGALAVEGRHGEVVLDGHRRLVVPPQPDVERRARVSIFQSSCTYTRVVAVLLGARRARLTTLPLVGRPSRNVAKPLPDAAPVLLSGSRRVNIVAEAERRRSSSTSSCREELVGAEFAADLHEVRAQALRQRCCWPSRRRSSAAGTSAGTCLRSRRCRSAGTAARSAGRAR